MSEPGTDTSGKPKGRPTYIVARVCVALVMLMWVVSGLLKVLDVSAFIEIVEQHQVIADRYEPLLVYVGPIEIVLGLALVFAAGSELTKLFGRALLVLSLLATIGLTYYVTLVDPVVLQESGCGCLGDYRVASGIENSARIFAYGKNVILIALHVVALGQPLVMKPKRVEAEEGSGSDG